MSNIVFFDFDGTLTRRDTLFPFLKFLVGVRRFYLYIFLLTPVLIAYGLGLLKNDVAKKIVIRLFINRFSQEKLFIKGREFSKTRLDELLRPEGISILKQHLVAGDICVLVSASLDLYLMPWAEKQGFSHILTTQYIGGKKIIGRNCYGAEKVNRIKKSQLHNTQNHRIAYGNSKGDYPMLQWADVGYLWRRGRFRKI